MSGYDRLGIDVLSVAASITLRILELGKTCLMKLTANCFCVFLREFEFNFGISSRLFIILRNWSGVWGACTVSLSYLDCSDKIYIGEIKVIMNKAKYLSMEHNLLVVGMW